MAHPPGGESVTAVGWGSGGCVPRCPSMAAGASLRCGDEPGTWKGVEDQSRGLTVAVFRAPARTGQMPCCSFWPSLRSHRASFLPWPQRHADSRGRRADPPSRWEQKRGPIVRRAGGTGGRETAIFGTRGVSRLLWEAAHDGPRASLPVRDAHHPRYPFCARFKPNFQGKRSD